MVSKDGSFMDSFVDRIEDLGKIGLKRDCNVISVVGSQGSGKSTLLNSLFGTHFPVMNAKRGHLVTSEGLMMAHDALMQSLIIDTGSLTMGTTPEANTLTFKYQSLVFLLAICDVLLVNVWYHDLHRYEASSHEVLEVVLPMCTEIKEHFYKVHKTLLVVVVRDYDEETPLDSIEALINNSLASIWGNSLSKVVDKNPQDLFTIKVFGLPSARYEKAQFSNGVKSLSAWLDGVTHSTQTRDVSPSRLAKLLQRLWLHITENVLKELPSQRTMLAVYRCREAEKVAYDQVSHQLQQTSLEELFSNGEAARLMQEGFALYHHYTWKFPEESQYHKYQLLQRSHTPSAHTLHPRAHSHSRHTHPVTQTEQ
eukprot:Blabericola_migrator_1__6068@NODE_3060_length_2070_cov_228_969546_g1088_i2_p1_GENE_NODE_3060_length_2070_cov_228_969546_g1088_i2NODE_3060_length_2070_cov_228_969546_g1088_i2_p1_ORF_typecomplete_len367_score63_64RHD3/PF05879_12/2_9e38GBP/PF02263_19/3_4e05Dynamin_N/PF00350_23/3_9e05MMR_HSR1/PF01926_23/5_9e05ABC_tran/PF00005_27/0_00017RsgA_GTPase/PF03193_16/0_0011RsgA_GTPase/PF03193_16/1_2e03T2SSE/PF00437_20/0_0014T2SSE/PF00437_20/8_4e02IIGP/PF05049_13/0_0012Septin/PF00735_18/0_0013FeoB_N/PF02421_1